MIVINMINTILILVAAATLWWFFTGKYQEYRSALARQSLFKVRDDLFDRALAGEICFDSKAYGLCRKTINGMIRYSYQLNFIQLLVINVINRRKSEDIKRSYNEILSDASKNLTDKQKEMIDGFYQRMHFIVLSKLIHSSLLLLIPASIIFAILRLLNLFERAKTKANKKLNPHFNSSIAVLDSQASEIGRSSYNPI